MATTKVKIHQKLGLEAFKRLSDQVKTEGVSVIGCNPHIKFIAPEDYIGKVSSVFNLGRKLEVELTGHVDGALYHFTQLKTHFVLVRQDP